MARILVVDDDITVREVVVSYLRAGGHEVAEAADGESGLKEMRDQPADLVVLDLMMPGIDGLEVCRRLRAIGTVPIIMLTALGSETDRVVGLESGADDYVTKPFSPRELVLRVQAVLRRTAPGEDDGSAGGGTAEAPDVSVDGDLVIDRRAHAVTRGGAPLALTAREFALLDWFVRNPGVVQRRDELMRAVWGWEFGDESTVTVHVRRVREKVEDEPSAPRRLVTVFGVGYRWDPRPPDAT